MNLDEKSLERLSDRADTFMKTVEELRKVATAKEKKYSEEEIKNNIKMMELVSIETASKMLFDLREVIRCLHIALKNSDDMREALSEAAGKPLKYHAG